MKPESKFSGELRSEKFELIKRCFESHINIFARMFAENESVTHINYKIVQKMPERLLTKHHQGVYEGSGK